MPTFQYKAYSAQGVVTSGTIVAEHAEAAIDALYGAGLTPYETQMRSEEKAGAFGDASVVAKSAAVPVWKRELSGRSRLGLKELTRFTVELASLTNAGLPLDAALRIMARAGGASGTVQLASSLLKAVLGGLQLSEAIARYPEVFPADYRAILAAGEAGGIVSQVLNQIAGLLTARLDIQGKIISALIYPLVLVVMSLVSIMVLIFVLVPSISPIFLDAGLPLPGILGTLVALQDSWMSVASGSGVAILAIVVLWRSLARNEQFVRDVDRLKCSLPIFGNLIRAREASRFTRTLGSLVGAGVPLMSSLQTARSLVINRYLNAVYEEVIGQVPRGAHLSRAFEGSGLLPAAAVQLIAVGEEAGQLGPMLLRIASTTESDLQQRIERSVGLLTPMLTLIVGGSIGALIMQVMSAVLSINNLAFQ